MRLTSVERSTDTSDESEDEDSGSDFSDESLSLPPKRQKVVKVMT